MRRLTGVNGRTRGCVDSPTRKAHVGRTGNVILWAMHLVLTVKWTLFGR
jgi:hypothetical protein